MGERAESTWEWIFLNGYIEEKEIKRNIQTVNSGFFFFSPFLASPQPMESQGQRSDPSHSPDPSRGCSNAGSLTHCAGPGIKPASQRSQDAANPILNSGWFLNSGYSSEERRQSQLLVTFLWGLFTFFKIYISILLRVFSNEHEKWK